MRNSLLLCIAIITLAVAAPANSCHRCGLFGGRCYAQRYPLQSPVQQYAVQKPYIAPPIENNYLQTLIFNNAAPPTQSLYGVGANPINFQQSSLPYTAGAKELLAVTSEVNSTLQGLSQLASQQLQVEAGLNSSIAETNRVLAASQSLTAVIDAARDGGGNSLPSQAFIIEMRNGKLSRVEKLSEASARLHSENPPQQLGTQPPTQAVGSGSILTQKCASCHGAELTAPAGGLFIHDGAKLSAANITKVLRWARDPGDNTIPEKMRSLMGSLTNEEKALLMDAMLDREG